MPEGVSDSCSLYRNLYACAQQPMFPYANERKEVTFYGFSSYRIKYVYL